MPTLTIAAQTVQPGIHAGAWRTVPDGVTSLVCDVDLSSFTDPDTVFGLRIEWRMGIGFDAHTLIEGYTRGGAVTDPETGEQVSATPGGWSLGYGRSTPTPVSVQARYIAAVGSLDEDGRPQLSGGNPVAIGASSVVVS